MRIGLRNILTALLLSAATVPSFAQEGAYASYTPYSIFGVGDLLNQGSAYNATMGGVGIASRTNRYMNYLNPASLTARDSLSVMMDFSVFQGNRLFRQGNLRSGANVFTLNDIAISFPFNRKTAMAVGMRPYSSVGYGYSYLYDNDEVVGSVGNVSYSAQGQGSLYEVFTGLGTMLGKNLSVGIEGIYCFGNIKRSNAQTFASASCNGVNNGYNLQLNAFTVKAGVQYEKKINDTDALYAGATYKLGTSLRGFIEDYDFSTGSVASDTLSYKIDTLHNNPGRVKLASEIGVGIAFSHADKWRVELDYTLSDWTSTGMDTFPGFAGNTSSSPGYSSFSTSVAHCFRAGFEIVPNRNDIRYYYKKIAYRGGLYYKTDYYKIDGHPIGNFGLTFGATLPIFRWYNGLSLGMDIGQRGTVKNGLIRERYVNFTIGVNLFDIWFQKPRYE